MDIRYYLRSKGLQWTEKQRPSGIIAEMICPVCKSKEKSFAVSLEDGAFNCMRLNNCGVKGSWWDFQKLFGDDPVRLDSDKSIIRQSVKYERPKVHLQLLNDQAQEFLKKRGFTSDTIKKFKIGRTNGAIMFPYFKKGELVNVKYRSITEKKFWREKNAEPTLFNRDNCTGGGLAICEGEFDAMALDQYGIPAVSIPSGVNDLTWIEHEWDFLNKFQKIYLFMDSDAAGQKAVEEIVNRLGRWRCYSVTLPYKDINECLMKDVEAKIIVEAITTAKEFDPDVLRKACDFEEEIIDLFENPYLLYGTQTPWLGLDDYLKGWRDEELTIWSGRNASGKSTMINDNIVHLIKKGIRVIIASLEMPPKRYLRWMVMNIAGKRYVEREEIHDILNEKCKDLFVINVQGEIGPSELINIFDFAARKYGVKHFVIDSLMKISFSGIDDLKEQKQFCNNLIDQLAVQHKGHVHLVAHPRKGFKDHDKPDKVDISGSGDITNLAHNVLMVWRPDEEMKKKASEKGRDMADTVLFVKKNREWGTEGHINFKFRAETKQFVEKF